MLLVLLFCLGKGLNNKHNKHFMGYKKSFIVTFLLGNERLLGIKVVPLHP